MAETNTISNLDSIETLAYNDLMPVDDQNDLDIFGAPITKNYTALQMFQYVTRAGGTPTTLENCVAASPSNITGTYNNGTAGVGATLTLTATGALVIDGRTMELNDRVLLPFQNSQLENGVWTVTNAGGVGINAVLTRATDFDTAADMDLGTCVSILGGSNLIGSTFMMYTASAITVGTTSILWRLYSSVLLSSQNAMTVSGSGNLIVNISGLSVTTIPSGTKTLVASGDNVTFGTVTAGVGSGTTTVLASGSLFHNITPVGNVTTGEDTLMTNNLAANTLITTGQYIIFDVMGTAANNANAKTVKVYFGSTVVATISPPTSVAGGWWRCRTTITRTGSNAQTWISEVTRISSTSQTVGANTSGTCTETETATITFRCTGEATATDDIIQTQATAINYAG